MGILVVWVCESTLAQGIFFGWFENEADWEMVLLFETDLSSALLWICVSLPRVVIFYFLSQPSIFVTLAMTLFDLGFSWSFGASQGHCFIIICCSR